MLSNTEHSNGAFSVGLTAAFSVKYMNITGTGSASTLQVLFRQETAARHTGTCEVICNQAHESQCYHRQLSCHGIWSG
jgi:hypothetical protein